MKDSIRVFVIEDSAVDRTLITAIINKCPGLTVIGVAADPLEARERMRDLEIDVVTLDVEMPRMNGLEFLEKLMRLRPMPVLMVSSLTEEAAEVTLAALELGAVDFVTKPRRGIAPNASAIGEELIAKIRAVAQARVRRDGELADVIRQPEHRQHEAIAADQMIAIGASTGGTEAIKQVLIELPVDCPPIVIAQHMPAGFTQRFAERLNSLCRLTVCEASHGVRLQSGNVYIAPGGRHLAIERVAGQYRSVVLDGVPGMLHKPSVDVLFQSVAKNAGAKAIGVMLTGMGRDGAQGMLEMRRAGAHNIAQDEATCVVYGMPREAVLVGAAHESLPVGSIARHVAHRLRATGRSVATSGRPVAA